VAFEKLTDTFTAFHRERDIPERHGRGRRDDDGGFYVTWCFANASDSDAFHKQFGGDSYTVASRNTINGAR
jgi:hypothetical protein